MSISRDDLRVMVMGPNGDEPTKVSDDEFDEIARAEGYAKLMCEGCGGNGLVDGHGHRPHPNDTGESHDCSSCPYPCTKCGGYGLAEGVILNEYVGDPSGPWYMVSANPDMIPTRPARPTYKNGLPWGYICRVCRREFDSGQAVITHADECATQPREQRGPVEVMPRYEDDE